ncbi:MAG: transposase [Deltaproteobacteria bacterium]|nr:transposase [Deltaproteobacteria bacterium]
MPRIARIIAPHFPHHVTQRGNNRATVFFDDEDRQTYLHLLDKYSKKFSLQIWAYCLMDNHIHLLAVPEKEDSLARGVGLTNQVYTQYLNRKLSQSGRIWQNRFYSCLVDNDDYLWTVARYIELNPVLSKLTDKTEDYRWSSAKAHLTNSTDPLLHQPDWLEPEQRKSYCEFMLHSDEDKNKAIRKATSTGRPFGSEEFIDFIEFRLNQTLRPRKPGRPKKESESVPNSAD